MSPNRFEVLEEQARILEEIAAGFPKDSPQNKAIEKAAAALLFVFWEHYESFIQFVNNMHNELSEEQKENLRKMGIPIEGEEDDTSNEQ